MANAPDRHTRLIIAGLAQCDPKTVLRYFEPTYRPNRGVARAIAKALEQLKLQDPRAQEFDPRPAVHVAVIEGVEPPPQPEAFAGQVGR